jgi:UDP-glucuronate 4-epimerase
MKPLLVAGTAGFIGFHLLKFLLAEGLIAHCYDKKSEHDVVALKCRRHQMLLQSMGFTATEALL